MLIKYILGTFHYAITEILTFSGIRNEIHMFIEFMEICDIADNA